MSDRRRDDSEVGLLPVIGGLVVGSGILACLYVSKNPDVLESINCFIEEFFGTSIPPFPVCTNPEKPSQSRRKSACRINANKRRWPTLEEEQEQKAKLEAERQRKEVERKKQELKEQKEKEKQCIKEQQQLQKQADKLQKEQQRKEKLERECELKEQQEKATQLKEQQHQVDQLREQLLHEQRLLEQMQKKETEADYFHLQECMMEWYS